mgnify:CR=1 FL=1|jgi:hypothetical protein
MRQTELFPLRDTNKPPYNGLFFCPIRGGMYRWDEFINWYKAKRL